jgi:hypothetical protein
MATPVEMLEAKAKQVTDLTAELGTVKADLTAKAGAITALTAERDTFKAQADASALKVTALEAEKGTLAASVADLQGKLATAEAKLKDPALLAAGAGERFDPVAGLSGQAAGEDKAKAIADLNAKIKAANDQKEKAVLRAQLTKLCN